MDELSGNESTDSSEERKGVSWIENAHLVTPKKGNWQYSMIYNDFSHYSDPGNPEHMNFGEAKLLQRITEIETRLQQIRGNMEKEQLRLGDRQQFYY